MFLNVKPEIMTKIMQAAGDEQKWQKVVLLIRKSFPEAQIESFDSQRLFVNVHGEVYRVGIKSEGIIISGFENDAVRRTGRSNRPPLELVEPVGAGPDIAEMPIEVVKMGKGELIIVPYEIASELIKGTAGTNKLRIIEILKRVYQNFEFNRISSMRLYFRDGDNSYRAGLNSNGIYTVKDTTDPSYSLDIQLGMFVDEEDAVRKSMDYLGSEAGFIGFMAEPTLKRTRYGIGVLEAAGVYYRLVRNGEAIGLEKGWTYRSSILKKRKIDFNMAINYPGVEFSCVAHILRQYNTNRRAGKILDAEIMRNWMEKGW